jgi:hypothetical protein
VNPNPIKPRRPLRSGDFSIRSRGTYVGVGLGEEEAWKSFLFECRGGGNVELLREDKPVAWLRGMGGILPS